MGLLYVPMVVYGYVLGCGFHWYTLVVLVYHGGIGTGTRNMQGNLME